MVEVEWSEVAKSELKEIIEYISQDSPQYAKYLKERIFESIENLETFPRMGRKVPEFENPRIRELILQNYRIVYDFFDDKIEIITIIHGRSILRIK